MLSYPLRRFAFLHAAPEKRAAFFHRPQKNLSDGYSEGAASRFLHVYRTADTASTHEI